MSTPPPPAISRSLFVFSIFYGGMVCIAGVLGAKLVTLGPITVEAGIFAFLLLVISSSAVSELMGPQVARRLVYYGFIPLVASMLLIILVLNMPPAAFWPEENRKAFSLTLGQNVRMMGAGIVSYGTSQTLNIFIFDKMKGGKGGLLWLRGLVAGVMSQIVDTVIFITISFYGVAPLMQIMPGQMIAKIVLSTLLVPPLIYAFVALAKWLDKKPLVPA